MHQSEVKSELLMHELSHVPATSCFIIERESVQTRQSPKSGVMEVQCDLDCVLLQMKTTNNYLHKKLLLECLQDENYVPKIQVH
jgi:hypothetical protein